MGRSIWGIACSGLVLAGCVTPYAQRVGAAGPTPPAPPPPVETIAPEPAPPPPAEAAEEPEPDPEPPKPTGIDVDWTYFAGKTAEQELAPLGGPEVEEQVGPWKCTISKQDTTTEGSSPVARTRTIDCKHWGETRVGTSVTCDLNRRSNEVTLNLGTDEVVVACAAK